MPEWLIWVIIGIVALIVLISVVVTAIKIIKMEPEERKKLLIEFLIPLITEAEGLFTEHGKGSEKLKIVEDAFNKTAPWFLKLVFKFSGCVDLNEFVKLALDKVKTIWGK